MNIPKDKGYKLIRLEDYAAAYKSATHTYDKGFLDNITRSIHIYDIFDNFIKDYNRTNLVKLELTPTEEYQFKYRPKALSTKLYGGPSLWQLVLRCNNMAHPGDMDFSKPMYVPTVDALNSFLNKMDSIRNNLGGNWNDDKDVSLLK